MPGKFVTPTEKSVDDMLGMLFGDVTVTTGGAVPAEGFGARMIDDENQLVAMIVCDYPFVGFSGAALSMMPAGGAEDMIAEKDFSKTIMDNFYEVMNICSRLFMSDTSEHLRLEKTVMPDSLAGEISALAAGTNVTFKLAIPKYGSGNISFLIA
ncbi:hypothetical protein IB286_03865 [Spongiibacter sp. KMU-158]|uniref:Uncharacterized protein n=1 Tax=Spongiibacter pelagi TaxID=2760804 RepID=A0A927BYX2_9GAMM|nr:hypothetical protein [Spongiibacter pelagi]MBD2858133.1 hypothetical protein [Spongiibacter pelagi]